MTVLPTLPVRGGSGGSVFRKLIECNLSGASSVSLDGVDDLLFSWSGIAPVPDLVCSLCQGAIASLRCGAEERLAIFFNQVRRGRICETRDFCRSRNFYKPVDWQKYFGLCLGYAGEQGKRECNKENCKPHDQKCLEGIFGDSCPVIRTTLHLNHPKPFRNQLDFLLPVIPAYSFIGP